MSRQVNIRQIYFLARMADDLCIRYTPKPTPQPTITAEDSVTRKFIFSNQVYIYTQTINTIIMQKRFIK